MSTSNQHIQDLAFQLFRIHGIKSVTMDDIAREAGVSKKTIYQNYENKEDLIISALKEKFEENKVIVDEVLNSDKNPVEKIISLYDFTLKSIHSYSLAFFWGIKKYHPNAQAMCTDYLRDLIFNKISKLLEEAQQQKVIRQDIDVPLVSKIYFWGLQEFTDGAFADQMTKGFDTFFRHFILNNVRGMLTDEYMGIVEV